MSLDPRQFSQGERERLMHVAARFSGNKGERRAAGQVNPLMKIKEKFPKEHAGEFLAYNIVRLLLMGAGTYVGVAVGLIAFALELKILGTNNPNPLLMWGEAGTGGVLGEELVRRSTRVKAEDF